MDAIIKSLLAFAETRADGIAGYYAGRNGMWFKFADLDAALRADLRYVIHISKAGEATIHSCS